HGRVEPWRGRARIKMELNAAAEYMCSRFMTDATIFVSHDIRRHSRLSNLDSGEVIYNGIDTAAESPIDARDRLDSNRFHIGIVGRIAPIKGHRILLSAVEQLSDLPDLQVHVLG